LAAGAVEMARVTPLADGCARLVRRGGSANVSSPTRTIHGIGVDGEMQGWGVRTILGQWLAPLVLLGVALSPLALLLGPSSRDIRPGHASAPASGSVPLLPPAPDLAPSGSVPAVADADKPMLGIIGFATLAYDKPSTSARRVGYLRAGAIVGRSAEPVSRTDCKDGWYEIEPRGFVCAGKDATVDLAHPVLRAALTRPRLDKALPYRYGFVRATLPLYLRVPTSAQQFEAELKLAEHLDWFKEHKDEVQSATLGAQDLPLDENGAVIAGKRLGELGQEKNTTEQSHGELFGGSSDDDPWPFWLKDNERLIPNISGFEVPATATFADRARRHYGLSFVGSFVTDEHHLRRRFAITTDLRLAPVSKVKPDSGSPWHGVELSGDLKLPIAFVRLRSAQAYRVRNGAAEPAGELERRSVHALRGTVEKVAGERYYELGDGRFARAADIGIAVAPSKWPKVAEQGEKWIEVDESEQVMVLWNGTRAEFATLVSTGRPAIGDPKETYSTIRGSFRIYAKHISATMDSDEGMGRKANADKGLKPGDEGYVAERGDGVYGVSVRRGQGLFTLRDVPHIQYFHKNYAIHGAYWHDVFGIARSHGCINLAPADSLRVFRWTEPQVPKAWHGVRQDGTTVIVHK
jgi:lipoprotein-anchoring transpeptidase ErfK/SrfK